MNTREKEFDDDYLRELFSRDMEVSEETNEKIQGVYDEIRRNGDAMRRSQAKRRPVRLHKRLVALAAAGVLLTLYSVTAFALDIPHADFLQSLFGREGIGTTEEHPYALDPHLMLPRNERVSVDTAMAETLVGEYINVLDKTVEVSNCTFALENCLIDQNGMGYITYRLTCADGLDWLKDAGYYAVNFSEDVREPVLQRSEWDFFASHSFIDPLKSDDTQAYLIMVFNPFRDFSGQDRLYMEFAWSEPDDTAEDDMVYYTKNIPLAVPKILPTQTFSSPSGLSARVSAVGIQLIDTHRKITAGDSIVDHELKIVYQEGAQYSVEDTRKNLENFWCASLYDNKENYVFNRVVNVGEIREIWVDGVRLTDGK